MVRRTGKKLRKIKTSKRYRKTNKRRSGGAKRNRSMALTPKSLREILKTRYSVPDIPPRNSVFDSPKHSLELVLNKALSNPDQNE